MMAHDSRSEPPELHRATLDALQAALSRCLEGGDVEAVRPVLRRVAREARERGLHAEQLLISLKDVWYAMPKVRQADVNEQQVLLQRLVTLCIREYYAADAD